MKNTSLIFAGVAVIVILIGLAVAFFPKSERSGATPQTSESGGAVSSNAGARRDTIAPLSDIELFDYDGRETTLAAYRGKPLVINSWATWCPFCRQELPDFARLQEELGESAVVIAIDRAERAESAQSYTDGFGITSKMTFLVDPDDAFYRNIGGFSMPETLFVDAEGVIRFHKRGPMTLEEMRALSEEHLK